MYGAGSAAEPPERPGVHVEDLVPFLVADLERGTVDGDARVVEQQIEAAEPFRRAVNGLGGPVRRGDVDLERLNLQALVSQRGNGGGVAFGVAGHEHDISTGLSQSPYERQSQAPVAAGDQRALSSKGEGVKNSHVYLRFIAGSCIDC